MVRVGELTTAEYAPYYAGYIAKVPDISLRSALDESVAALLDYLTHVPEDRVNYSYAPGKWTIKECLQHIIDTERIFAYRALAIAPSLDCRSPDFLAAWTFLDPCLFVVLRVQLYAVRRRLLLDDSPIFLKKQIKIASAV